MDEGFTYLGVVASVAYDDANHGARYWYSEAAGVTLGYSVREAKRSIKHYLTGNPNFFNEA